MLKKIVLFFMIAGLCLTSGGWVVFALDEQNVPIVMEGNTLYANGNSIVIDKDNTGSIFVYDLLGNKLMDKAISTSCKIYGGSKNQSVYGNISITDNVGMSVIYGGGYSDGTASADVVGNITIVVQGKNVDAPKIYGGGYAWASQGNAQANVNGSISIQVTAIPSSNHDNIVCGGTANTRSDYTATANVSGNIMAYVTGRTYSIRGGGNATTETSTNALAKADVLGNVSLRLDGVDIREAYGGGYATNHAQANTGNISVTVNNQSEIMILESGGYASNGAIATAKNIDVLMKDCKNIYGYVYGGGYAYNNGNASVNNVTMTIQNCILPADTQFDTIVSAGIYGGGNAIGAGSKATANFVTMNIYDNNTAATIYGGGDVSDMGNATVQKSNIDCRRNVGNLYEGTTYCSTVIAGGSQDTDSQTNVVTSNIKVSDCNFDGIWGGNESGGNPITMAGSSHLDVEKELHIQTLACFDEMTLKAPLYVKMMMGKTMEKATTLLIDDDMAVGTPLVYCDDIVEMQDVLTIVNNKLDYKIENNQSVWSLGQMTYFIETKASQGGTISQSLHVNKFNHTTIKWVADEGYQVIKVIIDGKEVSMTQSSYTFERIQATHKVEVQFGKIPGVVDDQIDMEKDPNKNLPDMKVDLNKDVVNQLLSEEDKKLIAEGKSIQFNLKVDTIENIPVNAQKEIEKIVDKENVLMTFDLSMFKNIDNEQYMMTDTNAKIRVVLDIPQEFLSQSNNQDFAMLRIHQNSDGSYTPVVLKDLDNNENTITFETNQFSIYSLIYDIEKEDIVIDDNQSDDSLEKESEISSQKDVSTQDSTHVISYLIGMLIPFGYIIYFCIIKRYKNFTKNS